MTRICRGALSPYTPVSAVGYSTRRHDPDPAVGALVDSFGLALPTDGRFSGRGKCLFPFLLLLEKNKITKGKLLCLLPLSHCLRDTEWCLNTAKAQIVSQ